MINSKDVKIRAIIAIIFLIIGFVSGAMYGSYQTAKWVAKTAIRFFESNAVELNIDARELTDALLRYRHEIDKLYTD